jgi:hypothetical protein
VTANSQNSLIVKTMDIVVHGTKGGRKIFTPKKISGLLDVTADGAKTSAIGQEAYAVRFTADNTIFSKYKIVRDVRGDKRTGFVGFSLFLPNNRKLSGMDIISLLDKVSEKYCNSYIVNNNLDEVKEDWTFFDRVTSEYDNKLKPNNEEALSGSKDDAFVYFKDTDELKRYFDAPFQEEYSAYRQVLFIDKRLEIAPENPLNALRHDVNANLTGRIDLENEYYYLSNYDYSKRVSISVAGKDNILQTRSDRKNNNCIRAKCQILIKYSKDERCYFPIEARGKLSDPDSEIYRYLEIKNNQIIIKYDAFSNPTPKTKSVLFEIKDRKGNPVNDAEIQIGTQPWQKINGYQYEHTFEGEELKMEWTVSVRKDDFLGNNTCVPENTNGSLRVVLIERNIVSINVTDEDTGYALDDFEVWTKLTNGFRKITQIEFVDEEIIDNYTITIRKIGYEEKKIDNFQPHRYRQKCIDVKLKRKILTHQELYANQDGKKKSLFNKLSDRPKQERLTHYESTNNLLYDREEKKESLLNKLLDRPKLWFLIGIAIVVLGLGIWVLCFWLGTDKSKGSTITPKQITQYVEGDTLFLEKLKEYETNWKNQKPKKNNFVWYNPMTWFSNKTSIKYSSWNKVLQSIENAKDKRELINARDFAELGKLEGAVKVDSAKYEYVKKQLGDVSKLTLTQIADSINAILTPKTTVTEQSAKQKDEKKTEPQKNTPIEKPQRHKQPVTPTFTPEKNATPPAQQSQNPTTDIANDIIKYLKDDKLEKTKLEEYKDKTTDDKLKKSIDLALKFWTNFEKSIMSFDDFYNSSTGKGLLTDVRNDSHLKDSKLKELLERICKSNDDFQKFSDISGKRTMKSIDKLINEVKK